MWEPDPEWHPLPGGLGPATLGVWRASVGDQPVVIKRLVRPGADASVALSDPDHFAYWRREAEVLASGVVASTAGIRSGPAAVDEDPDGITITTEYVEDAANNGLFVAHALGRFTHNDLSGVRHLARGQLGARLAQSEQHGGWPTLGRTQAGAVTDRLWARRADLVRALADVRQVPAHGDPTPANMRGRDGDDVVAVDWSTVGFGPLGADLGQYALSAREALEPLLEAYALGADVDVEDARLGAYTTAAFTALTRAEWSLSRAIRYDAPIEAVFRHPAVAPHLRVMTKVAAEIDWLLSRNL
ncbi:hypothetical protein Back2_01830 [Nocardioides baekrokdamisoli]|uniref:Uncharacterized protein n=1 Tax=Nocardioides baekrokdamisoli TaxID=1804624 RepID=A0A3G9IC63_9ACTN|nr:phosphotransferase [Nocardioides baekrokdamisoli]BBH15896.1 hypothetical protein Back2_01830 [Nocardioides baekrokdamisoli]